MYQFQPSNARHQTGFIPFQSNFLLDSNFSLTYTSLSQTAQKSLDNNFYMFNPRIVKRELFFPLSFFFFFFLLPSPFSRESHTKNTDVITNQLYWILDQVEEIKTKKTGQAHENPLSNCKIWNPNNEIRLCASISHD